MEFKVQLPHARPVCNVYVKHGHHKCTRTLRTGVHASYIMPGLGKKIHIISKSGSELLHVRTCICTCTFVCQSASSGHMSCD